MNWLSGTVSELLPTESDSVQGEPEGTDRTGAGINGQDQVRLSGELPLGDSQPPVEGVVHETTCRSVWVIDDDVAVLALLKSVFEREGHKVMSSGTVADAMAAMQQISDSALVVLDFNIPGGNGLDVLRELRQQSAAPVLMISNVRRAELVAQAFDLGANDFVEKPFDPRSLAVRARRLME